MRSHEKATVRVAPFANPHKNSESTSKMALCAVPADCTTLHNFVELLSLSAIFHLPADGQNASVQSLSVLVHSLFVAHILMHC